MVRPMVRLRREARGHGRPDGYPAIGTPPGGSAHRVTERLHEETMCRTREQGAPSSSPPLPPCGSAQDCRKWVLNRWPRVKEPSHRAPRRAIRFVADAHDRAWSLDLEVVVEAPLRQGPLGGRPRIGGVDVDPACRRDE